MVELYPRPGGEVNSRENRARRSHRGKKPRRMDLSETLLFASSWRMGSTLREHARMGAASLRRSSSTTPRTRPSSIITASSSTSGPGAATASRPWPRRVRGTSTGPVRPRSDFKVMAALYRDSALGASHAFKSGLEFSYRREVNRAGYAQNFEVLRDFTEPLIDLGEGLVVTARGMAILPFRPGGTRGTMPPAGPGTCRSPATRTRRPSGSSTRAAPARPRSGSTSPSPSGCPTAGSSTPRSRSRTSAPTGVGGSFIDPTN
jgi:hypothetical protein